MIPVRIACGCGQNYAFDVEPVNGQVPSPVACPSCQTDGTAAANDAIARTLAQSAAAPAEIAETEPAPTSRVRLSVAGQSAGGASESPPLGAPKRRRPGQLDPDHALSEARSKILWGDAPESIVGFLQMHGFNHRDAQRHVDEVVAERAAMTRSAGMKKVFGGIGMILVPIVFAGVCAAMGVFLLKLLAVTVMIGLWGVWVLINGIVMVVAPKFGSEDVAEM